MAAHSRILVAVEPLDFRCEIDGSGSGLPGTARGRSLPGRGIRTLQPSPEPEVTADGPSAAGSAPVTSMPPLQATLFELERMRCNLCGEVFTAKAPEGVGPEKSDASAVAMFGLLKDETGLPPPIHMSDALPYNRKGIRGTLLAHCLAHARRNFVDVQPSFPEAVRHMLLARREFYSVDNLARWQQLDPRERLRLHQGHSQPNMRDLKVWLNDQLDAKWVEPASGLGKAISYMIKHWEPLTLFLRVPGAVLDNSEAELAFKKVVLHRKNALFYRTDHGAEVGDLFKSLTHTATLNQADRFAHLVALLERRGRGRCPGGLDALEFQGSPDRG